MTKRTGVGFLISAGLLVLLGVSLLSYSQPEKARVYIEFERFSPQAVAAVRAAGGTVHYEFPRQNAVA